MKQFRRGRHILKKEDESEEDAFVCSKILETRGNFDKVSEIKNQRFLSKQVDKKVLNHYQIFSSLNRAVKSYTTNGFRFK